jgi:hypothetical protein
MIGTSAVADSYDFTNNPLGKLFNINMIGLMIPALFLKFLNSFVHNIPLPVSTHINGNAINRISRPMMLEFLLVLNSMTCSV